METRLRVKKKKNKKISLNRTMQYGNPERGTRVSNICGFKSYYVVWKPRCINQTPRLNKKFKSYYVVWKREYTLRTFCFAFRFKSYYVVWKLMFFSYFNSFFYSLNRTMQYGNYRCGLGYFRDGLRFKSYYVVWKLSIISFSSTVFL